jgi:hypothetical protein
MAKGGRRVAATTLTTQAITMDEFRKLVRLAEPAEDPPDLPEGETQQQPEPQSNTASQ